MKINITQRMLKYLSNEISRGRPLASILRAAEYLESSDPLFCALIKKAEKQFSAHQYAEISHIINALRFGATLRDLSSEDQAIVRNFRESASWTAPKVISLPRYKGRHMQYAQSYGYR